MALRTLRLAGVVALGALVLLATPATAASPAGNGYVGWAHGFAQNRPIHIDELAPCTVGGVTAGSTSGAEARGFVSFGSGRSACTIQADGTAKVEVSGRRLTIDALRPYGGPVIRISSFSAVCTTSQNGSQSTIKLTGMSGIRLPSTVPSNYEVTIPGAGPNDPPMARFTFNETIVPINPDGSMTVNLMRLKLFPDGIALDSGELVIGAVHCSPRG